MVSTVLPQCAASNQDLRNFVCAIALCHPYREENDTELIELVGSWYLVMPNNMDVHCTSILVAFDSCLRPVGTSVSSLTSVPSLTSLTSVPSVH